MLHNSASLIQSQKIVILILPDHLPRAGLIPLSILLGFQFLGQSPFVIMKTDLSVPGHAVIDRLDVAVYLLVDCLIAWFDKKLLTEFLCSFRDNKALQFAEQFSGFLLCDKSGRLYCIHQELHFRKLELPVRYIETANLPTAVADIKSIDPQCLNVIVNCLALDTDPVSSEILCHILRRYGMLLICPLQQHIHQV